MAMKVNDASFTNGQTGGTEMLFEIMVARQRELDAMEREITQRAMLERLQQVERLERALKRAHAKLQVLPGLAKVN
jgi:hypothetical protein